MTKTVAEFRAGVDKLRGLGPVWTCLGCGHGFEAMGKTARKLSLGETPCLDCHQLAGWTVTPPKRSS